MHVTIITVFAEMFVFVMSWAAFALLAREFGARRTATLLAYCAGFAAQAFAIVTFFLGHVIAATGGESTAQNAFRAAFAFAAVSGFLFCTAAVRSLGPLFRRLTIFSVGLITALAIALLASSPLPLLQANGMGFPAPSSYLTLAIFSPLLLFAAIRVWRSLLTLSVPKGTEASGVDRMYVISGCLGLAFVGVVLIAAKQSVLQLIAPAFILLPVATAAAALAASAEGHPDAVVRAHPLSLLKRSLVLKAVGLNVLVLWSVTLLVTLIWFPQHIRNDNEERGNALRRDVQYLVLSYRTRSTDIIGEATVISGSPEAVSLVSEPLNLATSFVPAETISTPRTWAGNRILRLVDAEGIIRYSTYGTDELGTRYLTSRVMDQALAGNSSAAWEKSQTYGTWAVRVGVPIRDGSGKVVGATMVTEVDRSFTTDGGAPLSTYASGYGFVAPDGDLGFSTGDPIEPDDRPMLREAISDDDTVLTMRSDDEVVYAAAASVGMASTGHFYAFVSDADANARTFLSIAQLTVLAHLVIALMAAMLFSAMAAVMRPLRDLRTAAAKLGTGQQATKVEYDTPDEIGQLAAAFNRTVDVVGQHTADLETAMRERQDFLDHAARELRSPLTVFQWTLEAMRFGDAGTFTKEQLDLLEKLHQTNMRLEKMVDNLQDVSQVDRDRLRLDRHEMAVEDAIDTAAGVLAVTAHLKDINLIWRYPTAPLPKVHADPVYVQKVLHNILENAVKYTQPHGTVTVTAQAADMSAPDGVPGSFIQVTIADSGIGIPTDERPHVFSRFFRAQNVSEFEIEGAGLGLYLAKRFVEMHGGDISLTSQEGVGTTVAFTLPVVEGATAHTS